MGEQETIRQTSPQSPYTRQDVGVGFVVFLIGMLVVFGIPLAIGF